jgi:hypothetical protein
MATMLSILSPRFWRDGIVVKPTTPERARDR